MQNEVCRSCAQSGIAQTVIIVNGKSRCCCCGEYNPDTIAPRTWGESKDAFIQRAFAVEAPVAVKKARCPHYTTIRSFFVAARESGLDTVSESGKDRCRGALGVYLGKRIASRAELTACDWENGITAVKAGVLFW
jgi:hypothetical protein